MTAADQTPRGQETGGRSTYSRRTALGLGAAVLAGAALGVDHDPAAAQAAEADRALVDALRPEIAPRSVWGADHPVTGTIVPEDDVRFLLVHHTASTNDYGPDEVTDQIRRFHRFHTGPEKGWPDVAYNFFVDRFGGIWEARQGSLDGAVQGDATGGSQGFALLCSLIGDHSQVPVSDETRSSLVALLAWLAERHGVVTEPGTMVDFVSRGSNRWPAGTPVATTSISGHRDMSQTTCPGDFAYDLLAVDLPTAVTARRLEVAATLTVAAPPQPTLVEQEPTSASTTAPTPSTAADPSDDVDLAADDPAAVDDGSGILDDLAVPAIVAGGAAAVLGAAATRRRRAVDDRRV